MLVSDQQSVAKFTFMPSAPTPPPLCLRLFLDFPVFSFSFPRNWPLIKIVVSIFFTRLLHRPWSSGQIVWSRRRLLHPLFWYLGPRFILCLLQNSNFQVVPRNVWTMLGLKEMCDAQKWLGIKLFKSRASKWTIYMQNRTNTFSITPPTKLHVDTYTLLFYLFLQHYLLHILPIF